MSLILLALLGILLQGCPASTWEQVRNSEDIDELRAFVQQSPNDIHVPDAVSKIAYLEFKRAVAADTRYAYQVFLQRHPDSVHTFEVNRRLEHLDFLQARQQRTLEFVLDYLRNWPNGSHVTQARKLADELYCAKFESSQDPDALSAFLGVHPNIFCRGDLQAVLEKLLYKQAVSSGSTAKLFTFIHTHPSASLRSAAEIDLAQRQVAALLQAARFERAQAIADKLATAEQHASLSEKIKRSRLDWVRSSFDPVVIRKSALKFDPESARSLRKWAGKVAGQRRAYKRLAEATALLRTPLVSEAAGDSTVTDPRQRWMDAEKLALSPEEDTAAFLLDLLGDSFLEVRRRAFLSLKEVMESLGRVRAESWLAQKKAQLLPKAQAGILLLRVAALLELDGQKEQALQRLEDAVEAEENPDVFILFHAARLAACLGKKNNAATLTRRLSDALARLSKQRIQAWEGLRDSDRGWLTLRQIFGVISLWQDALAPYLPDKDGQVRASPAEQLLGNWLQRSCADLKALRVWFSDEERKWALGHKEYIACRTPDPAAAEPGDRPVRELEALVLLVLSGLEESRLIVDWTACCHPRRSTRMAARVMPRLLSMVSCGLP